MPFVKRTYVDQETVITADNLNDIQDELLRVGGGLDGLPATEAPQMDGTAEVGSSSKLAREDHVHPSDTSRVPGTRKVNNKELSEDVTLGADDLQYNSSAQSHTSGSVGEALASQSRRIDALTNETKSLSGSVVTLDDGVEGAPLKKCIATITPVQDLHGQSSPYPAGGGKNKLPLNISTIKAENTAGAWNGDAYTILGVTFTVQTDSDGNITGIKANGTATANLYLRIGVFTFTSGTSYIGNGCTGGAVGTYCIDYAEVDGSTWKTDHILSTGDISFTVGAYSIRPDILVRSGVSLTNQMFYPMIRLSSDSDATFVPYSNICSITGWSAENLYRGAAYDASANPFVTIRFGQTVFGGNINNLTGLLMANMGHHVLNDLQSSDVGKSSSSALLPGRAGYYLKSSGLDWLKSAKKALDDSNSGGAYFLSDVYTIEDNNMDTVTGLDHFAIAICSSSTYASLWFNVSESDCPDAASFVTYINNLAPTFIYDLATPTEIQLTPSEVTLLADTNTIWADCGDVSIEYGGYIGSLEDAIARLTARVAALENA